MWLLLWSVLFFLRSLSPIGVFLAGKLVVEWKALNLLEKFFADPFLNIVLLLVSANKLLGIILFPLLMLNYVALFKNLSKMLRV